MQVTKSLKLEILYSSRKISSIFTECKNSIKLCKYYIQIAQEKKIMTNESTYIQLNENSKNYLVQNKYLFSHLL